jgi:hypothetical protein
MENAFLKNRKLLKGLQTVGNRRMKHGNKKSY